MHSDPGSPLPVMCPWAEGFFLWSLSVPTFKIEAKFSPPSCPWRVGEMNWDVPGDCVCPVMIPGAWTMAWVLPRQWHPAARTAAWALAPQWHLAAWTAAWALPPQWHPPRYLRAFGRSRKPDFPSVPMLGHFPEIKRNVGCKVGHYGLSPLCSPSPRWLGARWVGSLPGRDSKFAVLHTQFPQMW